MANSHYHTVSDSGSSGNTSSNSMHLDVMPSAEIRMLQR